MLNVSATGKVFLNGGSVKTMFTSWRERKRERGGGEGGRRERGKEREGGGGDRQAGR